MTNLKIVFTSEEDKKIDVLKKEYGVKATTELVRLLITLHYKDVQNQK